jgi:hypothetical protein
MRSIVARRLVLGLGLVLLPLLGVADDSKGKDSGKGFMQGLDSMLKGIGDGVRSAGEGAAKGAKQASGEIDRGAAQGRKSVVGEQR